MFNTKMVVLTFYKLIDFLHFEHYFQNHVSDISVFKSPRPPFNNLEMSASTKESLRIMHCSLLQRFISDGYFVIYLYTSKPLLPKYIHSEDCV